MTLTLHLHGGVPGTPLMQTAGWAVYAAIPLSVVLSNRIRANLQTLIYLLHDGLCWLERINIVRGVPLTSHLLATVTLRDLPRR